MKYTDAEGNEVEVPTEEEVRTKVAAEFEAKLKEADDKLKKLENPDDPAEKNWRAMRQEKDALNKKIADYETKLAELGQKPDAPVTSEAVQKMIKEQTQRALVAEKKREALSQFDEKTRSVVEHWFDKITQGEELNSENIGDFVHKAEVLANPETPVRRAVRTVGKPPRTEKQNYADTADGKELAKRLNINSI